MTEAEAVQFVLTDNAEYVATYKKWYNGKINFLVGQVMKTMRNANPVVLRQVIEEELDKDVPGEIQSQPLLADTPL